MSKFLFVICALILMAWVINFDPEAYQQEKQTTETEQLKTAETTEKVPPATKIKETKQPKKSPLPKILPKSEAKKVKVTTPAKLPTIESVPSTISSNAQLIFPLADKNFSDVISHYGDKRGKRKHEGIDIPAERGTPVLAVADGTVVKVGNRGNAGKQVWLQVGDYQYFYAHLDSYTVAEGDVVRQGDIVGTVGNTGNASRTLPHLHFGVYVGRRETVNPVAFFE